MGTLATWRVAMGTNTRADLQPQAPRLPRPRSLASYEEWRAHERQRRRSQSFGHIADVDDELGSGGVLNELEEHHSRNEREGTRGNAESGIRENRKLRRNSATPLRGAELEYATLELRVNPPTVRVDNDLEDRSTVVIVESANRPGTLVEVVERLTELGLGVRTAQISSESSWFVDVFHVTNGEGEKIRNKRTLERIENIMDLNFDISPGVPSGGKYEGMNVIEMLLQDEPGLLSRVSKQITKCHLNIYDALLWTSGGFAAILFTAAESGRPLCTEKDLGNLQERLEAAMGIGEEERERDRAFVQVSCCYDAIYVEKRFYRLKMKACAMIEAIHLEALREGAPQAAPGGDRGEGEGRGSEVSVTSRFDAQTKYTTFNVRSRDRPQLLFDAVCTLSDLQIDVFHAAIDADGTWANLEFFVKSSSGAEIRTEREMAEVRDRLGRALELGAPPVLCLQVSGEDHKGMLHHCAKRLKEAGLDITYLTSRTDPIEMQTCSVFYVLSAKDKRSAEYDHVVQNCCKQIGAKCLSLRGLQGQPGAAGAGAGAGAGAAGGVSQDPGAQVEIALMQSWNRLWQGID